MLQVAASDVREAEEEYAAALRECTALKAAGAVRMEVLKAVERLDAAAARCIAIRPPRARSRYAQRARTRNCERAGVLRRFLVETYGLAVLSSGSGVLDIAGGQGSLGFELFNLHDVPVTVVDPRPSNLRRLERKWQLSSTFRTEPLDRTGKNVGADCVRDGEATRGGERDAVDDVRNDHSTVRGSDGVEGAALGNAHSASKLMADAEFDEQIRVAARAVHAEWKAAAAARPCRAPRHWRCMFVPELWEPFLPWLSLSVPPPNDDVQTALRLSLIHI